MLLYLRGKSVKIIAENVCSTAHSTHDYMDYVCSYCNYEWRVEGNGGLVLGCWPNCPKCGTLAEEKE